MCTSDECIDNCNTDADAVEYIKQQTCDSNTANYIQPEAYNEFLVTENYAENLDIMSFHYQKPIELSMPYYESLRLAKPYVSTEMGVPPGGGLSDVQLLHYAIPALNTDIRFSKVLRSFNILDHPRLAAYSAQSIPTNFNWKTIDPNDSPDIKKKKALISPPGNQGLCGSCWSISIAGVISDIFVVSNLVDYAPVLSTTWSLACYPQDQCDGGNPANLVEDIAKGGIASDHCIDYSWCLSNPLCNNQDPSQHFEASSEELNKLIPKCGCYYGGDKNSHYLYFVEPNSQTLYAKPDDNNSIENSRNIVKKQILLNGPVIGGFVVFNNFMTGKGRFTKINGGVYLENAIYDDSDTIKFSTDQTNSSNYIGSHAIGIIGWGIEKNIIIDNNGNKADVPYWYCRNSWTESWGDNGFFKMAMYPYNKISQFDVQVKFKTNTSVEEAGGIILIRASKKPQLKTLEQINEIYLKNIKKINDQKFYTSDIEYFSNAKNSSESKTNYTIFYIGILILFFISIIFIMKYKK
jgi:hypothetical protein